MKIFLQFRARTKPNGAVSNRQRPEKGKKQALDVKRQKNSQFPPRDARHIIKTARFSIFARAASVRTSKLEYIIIVNCCGTPDALFLHVSLAGSAVDITWTD